MYSPLSSIEPGAAWVTVVDPVTYALKALVPAQFVCDAAPCTNVTVPAQAAAAGFADVDRYAYVAERYGFVVEDRCVQAGADGRRGRGCRSLRARGVVPSAPRLCRNHAAADN